MFRSFPDLRPFLAPQRVLTISSNQSKREILVQVARSFTGHPAIGNFRGWVKALYDREDVTSTGIGGGIAIPHAQHPLNKDFVLAIARFPGGVDFAAKDGQPVHVLVMMAAPPTDRPTYLKVLAGIAAQLNNATVRQAVLDAPDPESVIGAFVAT